MIAGVPSSSQDRGRLGGALGVVGRDADVERLALAHRRIERAHCLFQRRVGIEPVRIEDVDVVEPHPTEALVEAGEQIFAAAPFPVRAGPHVVAGLGRDDQFVAIGAEIAPQHLAEEFLGRPRRRPVVVGEVEVGDAEIERGAAHRARRLRHRVVAEVVPQAERDRGQFQPAAPTAAIDHAVVAFDIGEIGHERSPGCGTARSGKACGSARQSGQVTPTARAAAPRGRRAIARPARRRRRACASPAPG